LARSITEPETMVDAVAAKVYWKNLRSGQAAAA
jgi:hypothetical protein